MGKTNFNVTKRCASCGVDFSAQTQNKLFCSAECRVRHEANAFSNPDECWDWPKSANPKTGYGQLSTWANGRRKLLTAHRVSYCAFSGAIPDGFLVCHKCDNRKCFNPSHLFLGTQKDNMCDMAAKGRFSRTPSRPTVSWQKMQPEKVPRGDKHHSAIDPSRLRRGESHQGAKVTEAQVVEIRNSTEKGVILAVKFGITPATVSAIKNRKIWKHVL